jgi:hypothetical protein
MYNAQEKEIIRGKGRICDFLVLIAVSSFVRSGVVEVKGAKRVLTSWSDIFGEWA